jgi:hypothetical protein
MATAAFRIIKNKKKSWYKKTWGWGQEGEGDRGKLNPYSVHNMRIRTLNCTASRS